MTPTALEIIDAYFQTHLLGASWAANPEAHRIAAVAMACRDLELEIGEFDAAGDFGAAAVAEQAIWLLAHQDELLDDASAVTGESVEGAGSRNYRNVPRRHIAPRARPLLDQLAGCRPGVCRLSRG